MLQICEESGTDLAQYVKKAKAKVERNKASPQFTAASDVEQVRNGLRKIQFSSVNAEETHSVLILVSLSDSCS